MHIRQTLGLTVAETKNVGTAASDVAADLAKAKGSSDGLFLTASNNSAGLTTALSATTDAAAGLGTALGDAGTAASTFNDSVSGIGTAAQQAATAVLTPFQAVASGIEAIMTAAGGVVRSGFQSLQAAIASAASSVSANIERILSQLRAAAAAAARLQQQAGGGGGGQAARAGFARGGPVWGAGTSTSDSILARLSTGEYVINARATRRFRPLLDAINGMRISWSDLFAGLRGFNAGGFVENIRTSMALPIPRLAGGGIVPGMDFAPAGPSGPPLNIHLPNGQSIAAMALETPASIASKLGTYIGGRSISSTGRKPSWKR